MEESIEERLIDDKVVYDTTQTVRLKVPAKNLEEMRKTDPQGTIDYLFNRKEQWKNAAIRHFKEVKEARQKIAEAEAQAKTWKHRFQKELKMKKWWKTACWITAGCLIAVLVIIFTINQMMSMMRPHDRVPTSGATPKTPNHVLASVNLFNGDRQGSGTVISKGEKAAILTAAHNFKGVIGGPFWVYYPDGTYAKATLVAWDKERDLALATVDGNTITGKSYVPDTMPVGTLSGCGYTGGQGPNYRKLRYNSSYFSAAKKNMWDLSVTSGPFWDGDSGSGVFMDEACVGVTSQRDAQVWTSSNSYYKRLYAVAHGEIVNFLEENKETIKDCGDWREAPKFTVSDEDTPPLWSPRPNVPINTSSIQSLRDDIETLKKHVNLPVLRRPADVEGLKRPSDIKE